MTSQRASDRRTGGGDPDAKPPERGLELRLGLLVPAEAIERLGHPSSGPWSCW